MDDNSYITISSVDKDVLNESVISEKEQNDEFSIDETFFKDFFNSKDLIISPIRNNKEEIEKKNILEEELRISNESNKDVNKINNKVFHSTPIHKTSVLSYNKTNKIENISESEKTNSNKNLIQKEKSKKENDTIQNEKSMFLSPPSQPGFKCLRKFDNEDIYIKVKNLLNCSKDILNKDIMNKNLSNIIENGDDVEIDGEPLMNKKENINLNEFKINKDKFDKYSIFNNREYDISFERVDNLNFFLHKEIEKQREINNETINVNENINNEINNVIPLKENIKELISRGKKNNYYNKKKKKSKENMIIFIFFLIICFFFFLILFNFFLLYFKQQQ